jgi:hypothetical protein
VNLVFSFYAIDLSVFIIANLTNLLLGIMFLFRACGNPMVVSTFGWGAVMLGIPILMAMILNLLGGVRGGRLSCRDYWLSTMLLNSFWITL